jgi:hypothetical protein
MQNKKLYLQAMPKSMINDTYFYDFTLHYETWTNDAYNNFIPIDVDNLRLFLETYNEGMPDI